MWAINYERLVMIINDENGCNIMTMKFDSVDKAKAFSRDNYGLTIVDDWIVTKEVFIEKMKFLKNNINYFQLFETLNLGEQLN